MSVIYTGALIQAGEVNTTVSVNSDTSRLREIYGVDSFYDERLNMTREAIITVHVR
jgi:hypothetical protein